MKQRIITSIFIIGPLIPIFYVKIQFNQNFPLFVLGIFLSIIAINEMISMKETEKKLPISIHLISYLSVIYLSFIDVFVMEDILPFKIDIYPFIIIIIAISLVIHKNFKINDAGFILFSIFYIGLSFYTLVYFFIGDPSNDINIMYLLYIILVAVCTDTFAYFTGYFFGKHKLAPIISPKKTIEGSIGGSLMATILLSIFAYFTFWSDKSILFIINSTLILTIASQFGDLIASSLKRYYNIKDYGNLFPGHGGVLDRLDSILFTSLSFYYMLYIYNVFTLNTLIG